MRTYVAGPFFDPTQIAIVDKIEALLDELSFAYFSPRRHGGGRLIDMPPDVRRHAAKKIFDLNVVNIDLAELIVAVVDGRDVGTAWEIGYGHGRRPRPYIVTYTEAGHGVNVMLRHSVDAHVRGVDELRECLSSLRFEDFQNFDEKVY